MKKILLSLFITAAITFSLTAQQPEIEHATSLEIDENVIAELIELRRDIHQFPELAGEEKRTSKIIVDYLKKLELEVLENIGGYGVVGVLETGKPGKKIAWRADIDALATEFEDDPVEFKSQIEGVRHICGHDVHTVIALGIAASLKQNEDQLSGTYYFVFQPAEENITGAKAMLADGLLKHIQPDEFYALHMTPFPTGVVTTKPNELYAHYKKVSVDLNTNDEDVVNLVKEFIKSLDNVTHKEFGTDKSFEDAIKGIVGSKSIYQNYIYRESDVFEKKSNDTISVIAYYSFSDQKQLNLGTEKLDAIRENERLGSYIIKQQISPVSYVLQNDPEVTEAAIKELQSLDDIYVSELSGIFPGGRSDDFALFLEQVPGTYFFMGASNLKEGMVAMPHTPNFHVDESVIEKGVTYFSHLMMVRGKSNLD